jgi:hypothetical protein
MSRRLGVGVRWAPVLFLIALLTGCPFSSDKPLSDPQGATADPSLIGTWKTQDPESGEWNQLTIFPFNEHEMVGFAPEKDSRKVSAFRMFVTTVGTQRFLNVRELGSEDSGWFFARYEIGQGRMRLSIVDDGLFAERSFSSSADLLEFFRAHLSDPRLYTPEGDTPTESTWERVASPA